MLYKILLTMLTVCSILLPEVAPGRRSQAAAALGPNAGSKRNTDAAAHPSSARGPAGRSRAGRDRTLGSQTPARARHVNHGDLVSKQLSLMSQDSNKSVKCEVARLKCAYRSGCGRALQNYMVGCADVMTGRSRNCSEYCKRALIALTSTDEGQRLITCECTDDFCKDTKKRIEVCRPDVVHATHIDTVVSCSTAQWICQASPLCSTAFHYYERFCRSMFHGKKCTHRCNNSISILRRQEKAAKLNTCVCDGTEEYNCVKIRKNMDRLCFNKDSEEGTELGNEVDDQLFPTSDSGVAHSASLPASNLSIVVLIWTSLLCLLHHIAQQRR